MENMEKNRGDGGPRVQRCPFPNRRSRGTKASNQASDTGTPRRKKPLFLDKESAPNTQRPHPGPSPRETSNDDRSRRGGNRKNNRRQKRRGGVATAVTPADARKPAREAQRRGGRAAIRSPGEARSPRSAHVRRSPSGHIEDHAKPYKRSWAEDQRQLDANLLPKWQNRPGGRGHG